MEKLILAHWTLINIICIILIVSTILIALHTKESLEKRIINVIMIILLPALGSLFFLGKLLFLKINKVKNKR